jgi:methionyl-tRNA synthetase
MDNGTTTKWKLYTRIKMKTKEQIEFSEFLEIEKKLDIRIGQIVAAERVPKSDKLLKLTVIFGIDDEDERTVVTNIGATVDPDDLLALTMPFIVNLKPSKMMGITSEAMIVVGNGLEGQMQVGLDYFGIGTRLL